MSSGMAIIAMPVQSPRGRASLVPPCLIIIARVPQNGMISRQPSLPGANGEGRPTAAWTSGCPPSIQSTYLHTSRHCEAARRTNYSHTHARNKLSIYLSIYTTPPQSECVAAVHE